MKNFNERKYNTILGITILNIIIFCVGFGVLNDKLNSLKAISIITSDTSTAKTKISNLEHQTKINSETIPNCIHYINNNNKKYGNVDLVALSLTNSTVNTNFDIPDYDTSFKSYMDYRTITDKTSAQYELQQISWTDNLGIRRYGDYYLVAMGTYYSDTIGDKFHITFEDDTEIDVMIGDIKNDKHTDSNNMYSPVYDKSGNLISANVIEFIVDKDSLSNKVKLLGTISGYDNFSENIKSIEKIERIENKE